MAKSSPVKKVWFLLRKNLLLRKRQYVVTSLEIILPTVFAILIAFIKAKLPSTEGIGRGEQYFPPVGEEVRI